GRGATWFELLGAACLLLGFGTRFAAASLLVLTVVATYAVHWPMEWNSLADLAMGYAISDQGFGNFKLPVLFMAMLLPLIFTGAGRLSVDAWLARWSPSATPARPAVR
ncbi:HvfX family Cu-binding RiPP maturation protein, partial [Stenotrophomonas maltophilia]|uniref:HvfX family Cu-binding RiPP maturation protein n=1 Tax=Stenotrophomonas maltophilia TaxID=40324 RepID=UPI000517C009